MITYNDAWLAHHGVKGQKWGVRNGPPYPIEDTVLKKGTRLNSVSADRTTKQYLDRVNKTGRWLYTYNPNDQWDSKIYKGPFAYYASRREQSLIYEHQFEVVKDLKMPTSKQRIDEFVNLYKNDKLTVARDLEATRRAMVRNNVGNPKNGLDLQNLSSEKDFKDAYEIFNHAMEAVDMFKSTKKYAKIMSTKFDAMVDDNNQGIYNEAHDPIIIFRAKDAIKQVSKERVLTPTEVISNFKDVDSELQKKGKRAML